MLKRITILSILTLFLNGKITHKAQANSLGIASEYNVFVLGKIEKNISSIQGKFAGSNNIYLEDFWVEEMLPRYSDSVIIAGKNLDFFVVAMNNDNTIYGNFFEPKISSIGNGYRENNSAIDFIQVTQEKKHRTQYSINFKSDEQFTLKGINIFNIAGEELDCSNILGLNWEISE